MVVPTFKESICKVRILTFLELRIPYIKLTFFKIFDWDFFDLRRFVSTDPYQIENLDFYQQSCRFR
ncbi:hypothetical protein [Leptospira kirschneri]|uniref:hypothetical protein n=1 Tax=Leptospira kirschneri TaxID=29507 RepID=UPI0002784A52|nr:hypothetical protein [Leptospira kirschneri]EJO68203.1 hypothetical protein LEP1GSC044_0041 [Leptospira kirschneri serovar Grippotyphosa str. RM52]EKQ83324.1 hypothetical protein LEP1GSC064_1039 [Leptospira kirschneri serovar Grippotyphosa str. Moskva]EKR08128.1 hypothetical protein LEP1GSC122_2375 [Leptospira kirschneri serovar Valbuzzi str. 200702274]EMK02715.1 hypothetical protein LEP1GSC176_0816 [Leptospira kirschneri str. MMD1493]EMN27022.1 hypothetical protein LEP1GSC065_2824 [Leptosp